MPDLDRIRADFAERITVRRAGDVHSGARCVVYWMQRAQRALDNPALDVAVDVANALGLPCAVFFAPVPYYPHANFRHYRFLQQGIADTAVRCEKRNVGFVLRRFPEHSLLRFCDEVAPAIVIGDENPMREPREWRDIAARKLRVPLWTVDADVVVPSKLLEKEQYAARTIRPRLKARIEQYSVPSRNPRAKHIWKPPTGLARLPHDFDIAADWPKLDRSVDEVASFTGGTTHALRLLREFVEHKLAHYPEHHGKPELDGTSRLSPYLHFGQVGPQTVVQAVEAANAPRAAKDDFLDQLITWRELSINFVHFNPVYDSIESAPDWAHHTLAAHARDKRPVLYTCDQLEQAQTGDELWNAAQRQMLHAGWMHNHMRMYWAKKILEWSRSPAEAYQAAVYLNDKYSLDGRDPNGYAGVAWAIAGKFDRPWLERPIFGKVRYMSGAAAARKFDAKLYQRKVCALANGAVPTDGNWPGPDEK